MIPFVIAMILIVGLIVVFGRVTSEKGMTEQDQFRSDVLTRVEMVPLSDWRYDKTIDTGMHYANGSRQLGGYVATNEKGTRFVLTNPYNIHRLAVDGEEIISFHLIHYADSNTTNQPTSSDGRRLMKLFRRVAKDEEARRSVERQKSFEEERMREEDRRKGIISKL